MATTDPQADAYKALGRLLALADEFRTLAEECRASFDRAGLAYPDPLCRILDDQSPAPHTGHGERQGHLGEGRLIRIRKRHPELPPSLFPAGSLPDEPPELGPIEIPQPAPPRGVQDGWVYVPISAAGTQTLTLAVLRELPNPAPLNDIANFLRARGREASIASLNNVGIRLDANGLIARKKDGWSLHRASSAPILNGKYVWGARDVFTSQELAARRREAILFVMKNSHTGLLASDILRALELVTPQLDTALNKDAVRSDLEDLRKQKKIVRLPSNRWMPAKDAAIEDEL